MSHKKRDWSNYNKSFVNQGSITLWLSPEAVKAWRVKKVKGRPGRQKHNLKNSMVQLQKEIKKKSLIM